MDAVREAPDGARAAESLISARQLNTFYGASHILRDVDFDVARGETIGLMGRNGMGKSTLLKSIMGLVRPRGGTVSIKGRDMTRRPPFEIAQLGIAYVPEGRGIFGNLSVVENLQMAARAGTQGQRDWTYERVLDTFPRLKERLGHGGQQLSGGEQQMLTIGRALMTNPDVLILDEATEGLAPQIAKDIWRICDWCARRASAASSSTRTGNTSPRSPTATSSWSRARWCLSARPTSCAANPNC